MKNLSLSAFAFLLMIAGLYYWSGNESADIGQSEISTVTIRDQVFRVEVADEPGSWISGLAEWETIEKDQGMLFVFGTYSRPKFWMKDMNFAIDLLWIDGDRIIDYEKNMRPSDCNCDLKEYTPSRSIDKVLEIPAGTINELDIKIGDTIKFNI